MCHGWLLPNGITKQIVGNATGRALEVFFIVSGCFVAIKYNAKELKTIEFVSHELKKIYPLYLLGHVVILCYESMLYVKGLILCPEKSYVIWIIKKMIISILMLNSWFPDEDYIYAFNGVGWFCSTLIFLYFITPSLLRWFNRRKISPVVVLFIVLAIRVLYTSVMHHLGIQNTLYWLSVLPLYRFGEYGAGICIGLIFLKEKKRINSDIIQLLSVFLFVSTIIIDCMIGGVGSAIVLFDLMVVIGLVFCVGVMDRIGSLRLSIWFSNLLLSFYLFHQIIIKIYKYVFECLSINIYYHPIINMVVMLLLTLLLCLVVNRLRDNLRAIY